MPHKEQTGKRSMAYSAWHRRDSIKRHLAGDELLASRLTMIDIDGIFVEAKHPYDRPPVAIMEVAQISYMLKSNSYHKKSGRILYQLGKAANIPTFLILYLLDSCVNPASKYGEPDIVEFYVKELHPIGDKKWTVYTPEQYAWFLVNLRQNHLSIKRNGVQSRLPFGEAIELDKDDLERRWYVHKWEKMQYAR